MENLLLFLLGTITGANFCIRAMRESETVELWPPIDLSLMSQMERPTELPELRTDMLPPPCTEVYQLSTGRYVFTCPHCAQQSTFAEGFVRQKCDASDLIRKSAFTADEATNALESFAVAISKR